MAAVPESAKIFLAGLVERARRRKKTIVFPEGSDLRVLEAAARLARDGVVQPVLVGSKPANPPAGVIFADPAQSSAHDRYAGLYYDQRRTKGVTRIESLGKLFDAQLHQAMMEVEDPSVPAGTVVQELIPGYLLAGRLLRAAMVGVAKGGPALGRESGSESASNDA